MRNPLSRPRLLLALVTGGALCLAVAAGLTHTNAPYRYINVFREVWNLTNANYVEPVDENALLDGAYRGMVGSLDAASAYLSPGEEKELTAPLAPGRTGMEVLPSGGSAIIVRVDPGSSAEKAGLSPGDQIWRIAGKPARQLAWPVLKHRLSGAPGSAIQLQVLDGQTFKMRDVSVTLEVPKSGGFVVERRDGDVVLIKLQDPAAFDAAGLRREISAKLGGAKPVAALVDVRGVVGVDAKAMQTLAGVLYDGGELLRLVSRSGDEARVESPPQTAIVLGVPLYVLIDGSTAGIGEALAIRLKEQQHAMLLGRTTFGLAGIPELIPLSSGGTLLLSTREMRSANGLAWAGKGLEPDQIITTTAARADLESEDAGPDGPHPDLLLDETLRWIRQQAEKPKAA